MRYATFGRPLLAALLTFGLGACSDDDATGPSTPFDPDAAAQAAVELEDRLDSDSDVMRSLSLVAPALEAEGGAVLRVLPGDVQRPVSSFSAQLLMDPALSMSASMEPVFPSNFLGKTFEWDDTLGRYAMTDRAGAPATGVRFILYSVDPFTGQPVLPLSEIGSLDLTDESDASQTRLRLRAETGGVARLDYFVSLSFAVFESSIEVTATGAGFISDGTQRLDFDLAQDVAVSDQAVSIDLLYDLEMADQDVRVVLDVTSEASLADPEAGSFDLTMTLTDGGNVTVVSGALDAAENLTGTIVHNGQTVALIGGTADAPTFTDGAGEPLTSTEVAALDDLLDAIDDLFDFGEAIFEPFGADPDSI
ncbi:MAG: hypothetical protein RRA92_02460 [Gemmatimonadota bacterium]|nr:hypothetical protein [Gemmatimonadota bacterium]